MHALTQPLVSARKSVELAVRWWPRASTWASVALLFSISFTVFNLSMAALMPFAEFGLFSYGQSLVLLVGGIIGTLVLEPTTTVGTRYDRREQLSYLSCALIGAVAVGLAAALPLAGLFWIARPDTDPMLLITATLVSPVVQSFHLGRRYLYMREHFRFLIALGMVHAALLLAMPLMFIGTGTASPTSALVAMGVAGAVPTAWLVIHLRLWRHRPTPADTARYARDHWGYARWTLAATGPHWLLTNGVVPGAVWLFSFEAGSIYRLCQLVVTPILQVAAISSQIVLPFVSQRAHVKQHSYLVSVQRKAFWLYLAIAIAGTIVMLAAAPFLVNWLVPAESRADAAIILSLLVAGTFFDVLRTTQALTVSAAGRTEFLFVSAAAGALLMYLVAAPLIAILGMPAIAAGYMVGRVARYAIIRFAAVRWVLRPSEPSSDATRLRDLT